MQHTVQFYLFYLYISVNLIHQVTNERIQIIMIFLYNGTKYTLSEILTIFKLTNISE